MASDGFFIPRAGIFAELVRPRRLPICAPFTTMVNKNNKLITTVSTDPPIVIDIDDLWKYSDSYWPHIPTESGISSWKTALILASAKRGGNNIMLPGWLCNVISDNTAVVFHKETEINSTIVVDKPNSEFFIMTINGRQAFGALKTKNSDYDGNESDITCNMSLELLIPQFKEEGRTHTPYMTSRYITFTCYGFLHDCVQQIQVYENLLYIGIARGDVEVSDYIPYMVFNISEILSVESHVKDEGTSVNRTGPNAYTVHTDLVGSRFARVVEPHLTEDVFNSDNTIELTYDYDRALSSLFGPHLRDHLTADVAGEVTALLTRAPLPPPF